MFIKSTYPIKMTVYSTLLCFVLSTVSIPSLSYAQGIPGLPLPGMRVAGSVNNTLTPVIRGIKINPSNPFSLDFIVDHGSKSLNDNDLRNESQRMVKYFLAILALPQEDLWVNLSPYEKERIATQELGITELGKGMLSQDYMLKQMMASLTDPDTALGKSFWDKVYAKAREQYGNTNIPVNTFNKVWIVPSKASIFTKDNMAFVVDCHLKVMLDQDYTAMKKNKQLSGAGRDVSPAVLRDLIIPAIEKEVNEGDHFAMLRQIYYSFILAVWYKRNLKESVLNHVYANKKKVAGVDVQDKNMKEEIYRQYLQAFKKGVYNIIKEEVDPSNNQVTPRKYFSGGVNLTADLTLAPVQTIPSALALHQFSDVRFNFQGVEDGTANKAMIADSVLAGEINKVFGLIKQDQLFNAMEVLQTAMNQYLASSVNDSDEVDQQFRKALKLAADHLGEAKFSKMVKVLRDLSNQYKEIIKQQRLQVKTGSMINIAEMRQYVLLIESVIDAIQLLMLQGLVERIPDTLNRHEIKWNGKIGPEQQRLQAMRQQLLGEVDALNVQIGGLEKRLRELEQQRLSVVGTEAHSRLLMLETELAAAKAKALQAKAFSTAQLLNKQKALVYGDIDRDIQAVTAQLEPLRVQLGTLQSQLTADDIKVASIEALKSEKAAGLAIINGRLGKLTALRESVLKQMRQHLDELTMKDLPVLESFPAEVDTLAKLGDFMRQRKEDMFMRDPAANNEIFARKIGISPEQLMVYESGVKLVSREMNLFNEEHMKNWALHLSIKPGYFIDFIKSVVGHQFEQARKELPTLTSIPSDINTPKKLGALLRSRRESLLGSLAYMAAQVEVVTAVTIDAVENGEQLLNDLSIRPIAEYLKISPDALQGRIREIRALQSEHQVIGAIKRRAVMAIIRDAKAEGDALMHEVVKLLLTQFGLASAYTDLMMRHLVALGFMNGQVMAQERSFERDLKVVKIEDVRAYLQESPQTLDTELRKVIINKIAALLAVDPTDFHLVRIGERLAEEDIGLQHNNDFISERKLVNYAVSDVYTIIRDNTRGVADEQLQARTVNIISATTQVPRERVKTYLESLGFLNNNQYLGGRQLAGITINDIHIILNSMELDVPRTSLMGRVTDELIKKTGAIRSQITEHLKMMGLDALPNMINERELAILTQNDLRGFIEDLEDVQSDVDDASFLELLVSNLHELTNVPKDNIKQYIARVLAIDSTSIGLASLTRERQQAYVQSKLQELDKDAVELFILDIPAEVALKQGMAIVVIRAISEQWEIPVQDVRAYLETLGYVHDEDFVVTQNDGGASTEHEQEGTYRRERPGQYEKLLQRLNAEIVNLNGGLSNEPIADVDELRTIFRSHNFREAISNYMNAESIRVALSRGKPAKIAEKEGHKKKAKTVLWLMYTFGDIAELYNSIFPQQRINVSVEAVRQVRIPDNQKHFLENMWVIFADYLDVLEGKFEFPQKRVTQNTIHHFVTETHSMNKMPEAVRTAMLNIHSKGSLKISPEVWEAFKREKTGDLAMRSRQVTDGGIDLNEQFLDLHTKGQVINMLTIDQGMINKMHFDGLRPVIDRIIIIPNLYQFYGLPSSQ